MESGEQAVETMRAKTSGELGEMIGRMFEADHPRFSITQTRGTPSGELRIPLLVPDPEPIYDADRIRIHAVRAATLTVANVTSWTWQAGSRLESDSLVDMKVKAGRSALGQFSLEGAWCRLEAAISAPDVTLCIEDEIQGYWHVLQTRPAVGSVGPGDCTAFGYMSDIVERARTEGIELPEWVVRMTP